MRLRQYLDAERVVMDLDGPGGREAIAQLVERLRASAAVADPDALENALWQRERAHTTVMGGGIAVPHATVAGLEDPVLMVAIAPRGIVFGPAGTDPVRLFFLVLSPPESARQHIKLLARIARLVRHPGFTEGLQSASTVQAVLDEFERVDAAHV